MSGVLGSTNSMTLLNSECVCVRVCVCVCVCVCVHMTKQMYTYVTVLSIKTPIYVQEDPCLVNSI